MNSKTTPESILKEVAAIQRLEKGSLSVIRQTAKGPAFNFQRWEKGRNRSEYVPADQAAQVQENLQAHDRFETLVASYVESLSARSREERLTGAKKNARPKYLPCPRS